MWTDTYQAALCYQPGEKNWFAYFIRRSKIHDRNPFLSCHVGAWFKYQFDLECYKLSTPLHSDVHRRGFMHSKVTQFQLFYIAIKRQVLFCLCFVMISFFLSMRCEYVKDTDLQLHSIKFEYSVNCWRSDYLICVLLCYVV